MQDMQLTGARPAHDAHHFLAANPQADTFEDHGRVVPVLQLIVLEGDFPVLWPPVGAACAFLM